LLKEANQLYSPGVWHSFIFWITTVLIALLVLIKKEAISTALKKGATFVSERFWKWLRGKLALNQPSDGNGKTYKGVFEDYWYESMPDRWFFSFMHDGIRSTVRINESHLLGKLKRGTLVEVDTIVRHNHDYESVTRTREISKG